MKRACLVGVLALLMGPSSMTWAEPGLRPVAPPSEQGAPSASEQGAPSRPTWKYKASGAQRDPLHEPTGVGAFPLRAGKFTIGLELGWPFYELRLAVGVHHRVTLEAGLRGLYSWTVGGYGGLKVGLLQNRSRSTALSLRLIGGYMHLMEDDRTNMRTLGGGNGGFGELSVLGALRWGSDTLMVNAGARLSQVDECTEWDLNWTGACTLNPFFNSGTGRMVMGFVEVGYATRIHQQLSFFVAGGLDVFPQGGRDWPAMLRVRIGFQMGN